MKLRLDFITLFPEIIEGYFASGILSQGIKKGLIEVHAHYLRNWGEGNYRQVDDRVFGGGAGMLLMFEPMQRAIAHVESEYEAASIKREDYKIIATSAGGETYLSSTAKRLVDCKAIMILCGRYEGFDQRILDELVDMEISIGNYVLSGGELAGLVIADSVGRLVPGVLGNSESYQHDSFYKDDNLSQFPQYTRPESLNYEGKELKVPDILLSGHHAEIEKWRQSGVKKVAIAKEDK